MDPKPLATTRPFGCAVGVTSERKKSVTSITIEMIIIIKLLL